MKIELIYKLGLFASIGLLAVNLFFVFFFFIKGNKKERSRLKLISIVMMGFIALTVTTYKLRKAIKLKRIKEAGHVVYKKPINTYSRIKKRGKIAICMFYTNKIANFGNLTEKINRSYAKRHNYDLIVYKNRMSERDPTWDKLQALRCCMEIKGHDNKDKYNYIMWIDADAFFNLQKIALENFIDEEHKFFACEDIYQGVINAGVFIIKNDTWGKDFIKLWWRCGQHSKYCHKIYHEQKIFDSMYGGDIFGIRKFSKIFEAAAFNSDPGIVCSLKKGWNKTFVIHLMAHSAAKREELIKKHLGQ